MTTSTFGIHWIPSHRGPEDAAFFAAMPAGTVKIIALDDKIPYLEDVPASAKRIVVRHYPLSELDGNRSGIGMMLPLMESRYSTWQNSPYEMHGGGLWSFEQASEYGREHAATCGRMAAYAETRGVSRQRLVFEGLNEPKLWTPGEAPNLVAEYYKSFLIGLHGLGLRGVIGNFGVGWPGNGGVPDAPPEWGFFHPAISAMIPGDFLGLHEYWALNGPGENWTWWAGRFLQCPYDVPILITECGIDTGVTGQWFGGWRDLPGSEEEKAARYAGELVYYAQQGAGDGRVKAICPFTYDIGSPEWEKFDLRSDVMREALLAETFPLEVDDSPFDLDAAIWRVAKDNQCISPNPSAAIEREMHETGYTFLSNEHNVLDNNNRWYGVAQLGYKPDGSGKELAFFATNDNPGEVWTVRTVTPR